MKYLSVLPYITSSFSLRSTLRSFATSQRVVVGYATDVEGNLDYWNRYLSVSKVLVKETTANNGHSIRLNDGCHFVYGGDSCDRGPGCVRVLKDLVQLKESYPDRVHLILGNRDINKLRMQFSLHPTILKSLPLVKWLKAPPEATVGTDYKLSDPESKMKWILSKTMGSPIAYEMCRLEAQQTGNTEYALHPWKCFLDITDPASGLLVRYLELAQVAAKIGDVLFVHGAKHEHNFGWLPPSVESAQCSATVSTSLDNPLAGSRRTEDLAQWVRDINAFVRSEVRDYRQRAPVFLQALTAQDSTTESTKDSTSTGDNGQKADKLQIWESVGGYHHSQPASRLLQYGMGRLSGGTLNPSVVYSTYLQQQQQMSPQGTRQGVPSTVPNAVSAQAAQWLLSNGVRTVVVGHQPVGDAPLIMHAHGVQMISADTSYSLDVQWPLSQLAAMTMTPAAGAAAADGDDHGSDHACTSPTWSPAALRETVDDTTEWITYAEYERRRQSAQGISTSEIASGAPGDDRGGDSTDGCGIGSATEGDVVFASTRSPQAAFELTFDIAEPADGKEDVKGREEGVNELRIAGQLSGGIPFDFHSDTANRANRYVGRSTSDGWVVRLSGVQPFRGRNGSTVDAGAGAGAGAHSYYVLSHVEGYTFRNRLVRSDHIAREFADIDGVN